MDTPVDRFDPRKSFAGEFSDGEQFAANLPGGRYGYLPSGGVAFGGVLRLVNLGDSVSVRTTAVSTPLLLRSELAGGDPPSITYFFPFCRAPNLLVDGKLVDGTTIFSRESGQSPTFRAFGSTELASVVVLQETLRRASSVLTGKDNARLLLTPSTVSRIPAEHLDTLHRTYVRISRLVDQPHFGMWAENAPSMAFLRDQISADLIKVLVQGDFKPDHRAHQLQTASMSRIDRLIDENRHSPIGLQDLCERAGLAMRTVESIIRRRTQMKAHSYLQLRRLSFAREALLNPGDTGNVTQVAMTYGFTHLGRFSSVYKSIYGELPSQTLRNVLGYER